MNIEWARGEGCTGAIQYCGYESGHGIQVTGLTSSLGKVAPHRHNNATSGEESSMGHVRLTGFMACRKRPLV